MKLKRKADLMNYVIAGYLAVSFFYILNVVQPFLYAHHTQAPFLFTPAFAKTFLQFPGEPAEYTANFMMQFFYNRISGSIALFLGAVTFWRIVLALLNRISPNHANGLTALFPFTFLIALVNNYNLPFTVIVSVFLVTVFLFLLSLAKSSVPKSLVLYIIEAVLVYYISGSGFFLLFSGASVLMAATLQKPPRNIWMIPVIISFTGLLPWIASNYIFAVPPKQVWFFFYSSKSYFVKYIPSVVFIFFLASVPASIILAPLTGYFVNKKKPVSGSKTSGMIGIIISFVLLAAFAAISHHFSFHPDYKKVVAADYYCYTNNPDKTAANAKNVKDYSFQANVNYNLVISKSGQFTEKVFDFLQITGSDAIHPDVEFQAEMSFVAAEFYYNLGLITEARHWAYETLVFYPGNRRSLQLLVKIHLVTAEYTAARQYLEMLKSGFGSKRFIHEFEPVVKDTSLFGNYPELAEKRSFIPAEDELSPFVEDRLKQLLAANPKNKKAFEFLAVYYLLESDAPKFAELYKNARQYFDKIPAVYGEALLTFDKLHQLPAIAEFSVSAETKARFDDFTKKRAQYKNSTRLARNKLYKEFGNTYFYFREFVYPHIIKPDIIDDDSDYPAI